MIVRFSPYERPIVRPGEDGFSEERPKELIGISVEFQETSCPPDWALPGDTWVPPEGVSIRPADTFLPSDLTELDFLAMWKGDGDDIPPHIV